MNELRRVCVYCGSSGGSDPAYRTAAASMGAELARQGIGIVYGGASVGLMGTVADAALALGGEVIGVLPSLLDTTELAHRGLTRLDVVGSMHERKAAMVELSDAFVALPGGYGTLDELMEVLTWAQLGLHRKPIGVLDTNGFYAGVLRQADHAAAEGFLRPGHRGLLLADSDPAGLIGLLRTHDAPPPPKWVTAVPRGAGAVGGAGPGAVEHVPTREGYDRWAALYDTDANPLVELEEPLLDALLGNVAGLDVLDVGCGTGRHALRLAARGARVTGVDFSSAMLERARAKAGADRVHFAQHDLASPLPFHAASFDRVVCGLVLDHVDALAAFFADLSRVLRPGGLAVLSVVHPAMALRGVNARFHDPATGTTVCPRSVPNQLSDYVMAAGRAGLRIEHLGEHVMDEATAARAPRGTRYVGWPTLLLMTVGRG